jgi:L-aminopeptidase/D-esterase-like protein
MTIQQVVPLSSIPGVRVGHVTDLENGTGCSVIIVEEPIGAVCGVDARGGSPGTREIDLLDPTKTVQRVNAVVLSGGSAVGFAAADGVMGFLEEKKVGFDVGLTVVPIWRNVEVNMNLLGVLAVNAVQTAIVNAETLLGVRGAASLETAPRQPSKVFAR